jgi:DNA-directed RNA polymerase specialized sigma24 family protein
MRNAPTLNGDHGWDSWDWTALSTSCLREARRVLGSEQDAEEAAQDALLRAWRGRAHLREAGAEVWWVRRIARNEALRKLAQRARAKDLYTEAPDELLDGVPADQDVSQLAESSTFGRQLPSWRREMRYCSGYVMSGTLRSHVWLAWRECPREL